MEVVSEAIDSIPPFSLLLPPSPAPVHLSFSRVASWDTSPKLSACILFLSNKTSKFAGNVSEKIFNVIIITLSVLNFHWDFATTSLSSHRLVKFSVITVCLLSFLYSFHRDPDLVSVAKVQIIAYSTHSGTEGGGPPLPSHTQQIADLNCARNFFTSFSTILLHMNMDEGPIVSLDVKSLCEILLYWC